MGKMALCVCCVPTVLRSFKKLCAGRIHVPTQQILNMGPVYYEIHPRLRDLAFEELARVGLV